MIYCKYEFHPDNMPDLSQVEGEYVVLGYLTKDPAVYAEDGETILQEAVISELIAVDVLWDLKAEAQFPWQANRVLPKKHLHWVFGMEYYFENKGV